METPAISRYISGSVFHEYSEIIDRGFTG